MSGKCPGAVKGRAVHHVQVGHLSRTLLVSAPVPLDLIVPLNWGLGIKGLGTGLDNFIVYKSTGMNEHM